MVAVPVGLVAVGRQGAVVEIVLYPVFIVIISPTPSGPFHVRESTGPSHIVVPVAPRSHGGLPEEIPDDFHVAGTVDTATGPPPAIAAGFLEPGSAGGLHGLGTEEQGQLRPFFVAGGHGDDGVVLAEAGQRQADPQGRAAARYQFQRSQLGHPRQLQKGAVPVTAGHLGLIVLDQEILVAVVAERHVDDGRSPTVTAGASFLSSTFIIGNTRHVAEPLITAEPREAIGVSLAITAEPPLEFDVRLPSVRKPTMSWITIHVGHTPDLRAGRESYLAQVTEVQVHEKPRSFFLSLSTTPTEPDERKKNHHQPCANPETILH